MIQPKKSKYTYIIGIDPDVDKSGIAFWILDQKLRLEQYDLHDSFHTLLSLKNDCFVRLEAGWLIKKKNWNGGGFAGANDVGRNHEIGRQIEKFCKRFEIPYDLIKPCGLSSVGHERFCKITGWDVKTRTNSEKRVAGLLAFRK